ncbi:secretory carrier-associated membrane protein 1-like isoform X3 [Portunus trituberculatus]|uniref:secretory carrier-associated membrane protein 1-like isoform X3 n=1 Tax=Portunus trituberculatus TaxID=210409 RepID=UPI001E1CDBF8|nr:secretory carrier-associated membrane protein 1-like isoform X3 [Portunus trituberculatus]
MTHNSSTMSNFDDNPFADPFSEPSIQQATRNTTSGLEEYDPFSGKPATQTVPTTIGNAGNPPTYVQPTVGVTNQPAVVNPTPTPANPPAYTPSAQQQVTTAEFQELKRRQEELEKKAEELARKEEELKNAGAGAARQDNWPPLPSICPVGPCFYQDINVDIPLEFQKIVRMLYYLWMFHVLMLMLNILGGLGMFIALGDGATFGLAIVYFALFTPFSYICWFRPIYKAFRSDSSFNFMVFFFVFSFQLIVSIINAIGIPSMGSCGFILGLSTLATDNAPANYIVGIIVFMIALGFATVAAIDAILLIKVHRIYRSTGASFAKAQAEFSQGVMRNEHVQTATANAASAVIRNQMNQATSGGANSASPRF